MTGQKYLVKRNVERYVNKAGLRLDKHLWIALESELKKIIDRAMARAKLNFRTTVKPRDI